MNSAIVVTTINDPTEAMVAFSRVPRCRLVVVGDKKTPRGWTLPGAVFLAADAPETARFSLSAALPYNHYCRKMLGYLYAVQTGADTIVDTDDDNIPKQGWAFPSFDGAFEAIAGGPGFINVYRYYAKQAIWPRGLPLRLINDKAPLPQPRSAAVTRVGVWQGLADEDPDVDAIYRLTSDTPCFFEERAPLVLPQGIVSPFNSQNTMFRRELFSLLYLPATVTFRFTDILRGLVAQPIMWLKGFHLGFTNATVVQKRNPHDYFKDFVSEIPMYEHGEKALKIVQEAISSAESVGENLRRGYAALNAQGIVADAELKILESWLSDLEAFGS